MKLNQKYQKCKRCHRKLKTEEAQRRGYGQHCFQQHLLELKKNSKNLIDIAQELEKSNAK
ncbi:DUF6011 domain-containing protein [uncultured Clostridium sp.]|uniref:DUF6011 domain-containing protein n=1 Tax=uncultured Clostridium sp. TaxID=59620 RepID=UPI0026E987AE|nr:DUF6011 domain-containing protein [uncultured Clostridium sp.]